MIGTDADRPRLVLAYADAAQAARQGRSFRRRGWEVHQTASGVEARRLAADLNPSLVILDTQLPDESGWLVCAKLRLEQPQRKIVLVDPQLSPEKERLGEFIGASATVSREADATVLFPEEVSAVA